jgi:hypothetical protein
VNPKAGRKACLAIHIKQKKVKGQEKKPRNIEKV